MESFNSAHTCAPSNQFQSCAFMPSYVGTPQAMTAYGFVGFYPVAQPGLGGAHSDFHGDLLHSQVPTALEQN